MVESTLQKKGEMVTILSGNLPVNPTSSPPNFPDRSETNILCNVLGIVDFPISYISGSLKKKFRVVYKCQISNLVLAIYTR